MVNLWSISFSSFPTKDLFLTGAFFCFGFLATNFSFQSSSAAFVETIKAAEPITSAATAVAWGIETLSTPESVSLAVVVVGVLMSTLGNARGGQGTATFSDNIRTCAIVMIANLCFSFRGLHQKLFRASPIGSASLVDDLNLQYRMQQIGVGILVVPVLMIDMPSLIATLWKGVRLTVAVNYLGLAIVNGFAFTCYNLASTFVLTRISVVHHAALNCLRRIFAIVVTSILFRIPISFLGMTGVMVSFVGFMSFTHYKAQRQKTPKPISTLLPMSAVWVSGIFTLHILCIEIRGMLTLCQVQRHYRLVGKCPTLWQKWFWESATTGFNFLMKWRSSIIAGIQ